MNFGFKDEHPDFMQVYERAVLAKNAPWKEPVYARLKGMIAGYGVDYERALQLICEGMGF